MKITTILSLLHKRYLPSVGIIILISISGCQKATTSDVSQRDYPSGTLRDRIMEMYRDYAEEFPLVQGISVEELQQQQQELVLVDVRSPEEIAVSFIPGAITKEKLENNLDRYRSATVVVYCTIAYRSGKYARKLRQQGIEALNLEGSLLAWSHIGGKLVNKTGATKQIHVFSRQWQLTAEGYEPVW